MIPLDLSIYHSVVSPLQMVKVVSLKDPHGTKDDECHDDLDDSNDDYDGDNSPMVTKEKKGDDEDDDDDDDYDDDDSGGEEYDESELKVTSGFAKQQQRTNGSAKMDRQSNIL